MKAVDRLFMYFEAKNIRPGNFERTYGFSNGYFGSAQKRGSDLGETIIIKVLEACPDLDPLWFVTGEGDMFKKEHEATPPEHSTALQEEMQHVYEEALSAKETEMRRMLSEMAVLRAEIKTLKCCK